MRNLIRSTTKVRAHERKRPERSSVFASTTAALMAFVASKSKPRYRVKALSRPVLQGSRDNV